MNNMAFETIKILGAILELCMYYLNSTANSAYSLLKWAKWAELAVLFSWQLQKSTHDFDFSIANYSSELISNFH